MQGRRKFRQVDFVVIGVLYIGSTLDVWTGGWVALTDDALFGNDDKDGKELPSQAGNVRIQMADHSRFALGNSLAVLCVKCVLCLVLAFVADLRNRKFALYFVSLCLCIATPIVGVVTSLTRNPAVALSLPWLAAVLFVTAPLKFSLIFSQRINPSRDQTRMVVALYEFMLGCCAFLLTTCFSDRKGIPVSTLVTVWAVVIAPLGIIIILLTIAIRSHCTSDTPKEPTLKKLFNGIRQDVAAKDDSPKTKSILQKREVLRVVMFALLMCPSVAATVVIEAHGKVARTLTKEAKLEGSWLEFVGALTTLVAIPILSLIVSLSRGIRGTLCDYMVLVLAHVLNTVIMLLIYLYFRNVVDFRSLRVIPAQNRSGDPTWVEPLSVVPRKGKALVYVFFPGKNEPYIFQSSSNENPKKVSVVYDEVPVNGSLKYDFSVWRNGGPRLNQSVILRENKRYFFVATGTPENLKELIYVSDVRDYTPVNADCVIILTTIAIGRRHARTGMVAAYQKGEIIQSSSVPEANSSRQWCLPVVNTTYSFEIPSRQLRKYLNTSLVPYREWVLVISWEPDLANPDPTVFRFKSFSMIGHTITLYRVNKTWSERRTKTGTMLQVSHGAEGVVAAAAKIGYVHFFWMEAPHRLRTTIFACTLVANEVAKWLVHLLVEEIRGDASFAILLLSFVAGLVHVTLGAIYDFKLRRN